MGQVLNFDAVRCETVQITKTPPGETAPRNYALRDDIPPEIMLGAFGMQPLAERMQAAAMAHDGASCNAAWEEYQREVARLCTQVFQHTYPAMTEAEVCRVFTHSEREQIVQLFFGRRSAQLQEQSLDTASGMTEGIGGTGERVVDATPPAAAPTAGPLVPMVPMVPVITTAY